MVNDLILFRNDLLLLLPEGTDEQFKGESLEVNTLNSQTYNPVYGHVMQCGPEVQWVGIGDKAFFQIFTFTVARDRAYGSQDKDFEKEYSPVTHFAFKENGHWYLIIRESSLYGYVQDASKEVNMLNDYILAFPVIKEKQGLILAPPHYHKETWEQNMCALAYGDIDCVGGTLLHTEKFCQTTLEESYNFPILPTPLFIIESKNIIAMEIDGKYEAGRKRVIILPDEINQETESGLVDTSLGKERLLTGKVISIGPGASDWGVGNTVLFARNSGMPIAGTDYIVLNDDPERTSDIFAKVKI